MSRKIKLSKTEQLTKAHNKEQFDCGDINLNMFLKKYALQNHKINSSKTYVSIDKSNKNVIAYYTLAYGSVEHIEATPQVKKRMPQYPIPAMILARLAVDINYQGYGIGQSLLKDAIERTLGASEIAGLRAVVAHAKDNQAKEFYIKHGFESSTLDNYHMMLSLK